MMTVLPWICTNPECDNKWVDNMFTTWELCPECGWEAQHEKAREWQPGDESYIDTSE